MSTIQFDYSALVHRVELHTALARPLHVGDAGPPPPPAAPADPLLAAALHVRAATGAFAAAVSGAADDVAHCANDGAALRDIARVRFLAAGRGGAPRAAAAGAPPRGGAPAAAAAAEPAAGGPFPPAAGRAVALAVLTASKGLRARWAALEEAEAAAREAAASAEPWEPLGAAPGERA
jgi:hypothetical protein